MSQANIGVVGLAVMGSNLARNLASREGNRVAVYNRSWDKTETLVDHKMHSEWGEIDAEAVAKIAACKAAGGRVIPVGTTALRLLESAARDGALAPFSGDTDIFITPGFEFRVVDALITNFHLPESTLLMTASAFGGYPLVMKAYKEAIKEKYRFFSYGDAMLIL